MWGAVRIGAACTALLLAAAAARPGGSPAAAAAEVCSAAIAAAAVERAHDVVEHLKSDRRDAAFAARLAQAEGALIAPAVGSSGPAVFLVRDGPAGEWSYPWFYAAEMPGLPAAGTAAVDAALLVLNRSGVERILDGGLELKRDGPLTFVAPGPGVEGTLGMELLPDVMIFLSDPRADASGTRLSPLPACAEAYYGSPLSPSDVVPGKLPRLPAADRLRESLLALPPPRVLPR
ncbi:MAG: hypothetical protein U0S49_02335 [Rhodospirillales bacterium]|nr:hypothetical protein [Rhodospirillales bacterium]